MREIFKREEESRFVEIEVEVDADEFKESHSWLLSVFIKPTKNSIESDDFEQFLEIKESLIIALNQEERAIYSGSRVVDGWSELYFYAKEAKGLENTIAYMLKDSGYKYENSVVKDAKWDFFHKQLFPTELEFCNIESRKIIFLLEEEGDELEASREVEYYVSFDTATQKERFIDKALDLGFEFKDDISSEEFAHGVAFVKKHAVLEEIVNEVVKTLFLEVKKEHGYYEGWSTTIVNKSAVE